MDTVRYSPLGSDIESWGVGWQIAGLRIDNPSGSWLFVPEANRYIPPYTVGWSTAFKPTLASVSIRYSDSPTGTPSEQVGGPIKAQVFDTPQPISEGYASGASGQQVPGAAPLTVYDAQIDASEVPGAPVVFIPSIASTIIVPRQVILSYSYSRVGFSSGLAPRTPVVVAILYSGGVTFQELWISPESPYTYVPVIEGLKTQAVGASLAYVAMTVPGGGSQGVHLHYEYYRLRQ